MTDINWIKTQTIDDSTRASDPVFIRLSDAKLFQFHPALYQKDIVEELFQSLKFWKSYPPKYLPVHPILNTSYQEHLLCGDSRAAMVVSIKPLLVAAYTDEFDCIAMLRFPDSLVSEYKLKMYDRLLTVNLYRPNGNFAKDLEHGDASYHRYFNFIPFIAEFLSDDLAQIKLRKSQILAEEWARTKYLAEEYIVKNGKTQVRDGRPLYCEDPAQIDRNNK
jgi:hypothetical protein